MAAEYKAANAPPKAARQPKVERAKLPRTQIDPVEWMIAFKMQRSVTFVPGSSHKRFVNGLTVESQLSDRGRQYLAYVAHRYRRQWSPNHEEFAWIVQWGTWVNPSTGGRM